MLRFFKLAFRHISNSKLTTAISITGMASGVTGFILLTLFLNYFLSYDRFNENIDSLYRVEQIVGTDYNSETPAFLGEKIQNGSAGVAAVARICPVNDIIITDGGNSFSETGLETDSMFLEMFSYPLIAGNLDAPLSKPNSIILSETLARKIFGSTDAIGRSFTLSERGIYEVTAIMQDPPENSVLQFSYLIDINDAEGAFHMTLPLTWDSGKLMTWVMLEEGANQGETTRVINNIAAEFDIAAGERELFLKPLKEIALRASGDSKKIVIVYTLAVIAFLILLVGSINFMQLLVNLFIGRIRENGIRKILGGSKAELAGQFIGEGMLLALVSFLLALVLSALALPLFNSTFYVNLELDIAGDAGYYLGIMLVVLLAGFAAAIYPSLMVIGLGKSYLLKRSNDISLKRGGFRNFLVTLQLAMSVFLVVCTIALYQQVNYVRSMDKGFNTGDIIVSSFRVTETSPGLAHSYRLLEERLAREPWVVSSTLSTGAPFMNIKTMEIDTERDGELNKSIIATFAADRNFVRSYGLAVADGVDLSGTDLPKGATLVNESACRQFGWDEPLGMPIGYDSLIVVGVVRDFNFGDLNWKIRPLVITCLEEEGGDNFVFSVRLAHGITGATDRRQQLEMTDSLARSVIPGFDAGFIFIEELIPYDFVTGISDGFLMFSLIALFIASIGLFGLIAYNIEREKRETGLRKAFGCSSAEIIMRVLYRYLKLFVISVTVGSLLALLLVSRVMTIFAYREPVGLSPFLVTIGLFAAVMILSVSGSALKAAFTNPAESIRYE